MRVDICNERDEVIGQAFLDDDGSVRLEGFAADVADQMLVIGPDGPKEPSDGAAYLEAMPFAFRNAYCHAVLVR